MAIMVISARFCFSFRTQYPGEWNIRIVEHTRNIVCLIQTPPKASQNQPRNHIHIIYHTSSQSLPRQTYKMQYSIIALLPLLAFVAALPAPQGVPPPIERCTLADEGKSCNAGEINGFRVTGECTSIPAFNTQQYVCFPGGTLGGQTPADK